MREYRLKSYEHFKECWDHVKAGMDAGFGGGKELLLVLQRPRRNSLDNRKMHAIIGDIHKQAVIELQGAKIPLICYEFEVCKAFMVRWFDLDLVEMGEPLRKCGRKVIDPVSGEVIYIRPSTTEFSEEEAKKFINWLWAWGAQHDVVFSDPATKAYEQFING